jgi:hypothetical protein
MPRFRLVTKISITTVCTKPIQVKSSVIAQCSCHKVVPTPPSSVNPPSNKPAMNMYPYPHPLYTIALTGMAIFTFTANFGYHLVY